MKKAYIWVGVLLLLVVGYFLYKQMPGYNQPAVTNNTTSPSPEVTAQESTSPAADETVVTVADDPKYGKILVGKNGMTLYIYTKDSADTVACTGQCLVNWPPLMTKGSPTAGTGVDQAMLGSAALADGSKIVTYNHMPLYYWIKDKQAGDVTGQGVGGVWFVVSPEGKLISK